MPHISAICNKIMKKKNCKKKTEIKKNRARERERTAKNVMCFVHFINNWSTRLMCVVIAIIIIWRYLENFSFVLAAHIHICKHIYT